MRNRVLLILLTILPSISFFFPATAFAGDVLRLKGDFVVAQYDIWVGCQNTSVAIVGAHQKSKNPPGSGSAESVAMVFISRYNWCLGDLVLAAEGTATGNQVQLAVDQQLTFATLDATVELHDAVSGSTFPVSVAVAWTGRGEIGRDLFRFQFQSPGCTVTSSARSTSRSAVATGTLSDGTTNFIPEPSLFASINNTSSGQVSGSCQG